VRPPGSRSLRYIVMGSRTLGCGISAAILSFLPSASATAIATALTRYAYLCCDLTFTNATVFDLPVVSIALVQGDALGGGFEASIS
jgi:DSF synthase